MVIGGSLAGLFAAGFLLAIGWNVTIFERSRADLGGRGTGLDTRPELFEAMRAIGARLDASVGVQVRSRLGFDRLGIPLCEVPIPSITTAWDRIYRALRAIVPDGRYRCGMTLPRFEMAGGTVVAWFEDGSRAVAELLIRADGIGSTVRSQLMPQLQPSGAGYGAWRGVAVELDLPPALHDILFKHMTFCFPDGELALSVPMPPGDVPAGRAGMRRCQFSWFGRADGRVMWALHAVACCDVKIA